ncbi:hypothetical protein KY317_03615 [Candidatus Woesearchaeota archaeon]|nr:hypothetical protein [Candidatus Woesearchaeota archaeon]
MKLHKDCLVTAILVMVIVVLFVINLENMRALEVEDTSGIDFDRKTNTIHLDSLTLRQKIGQMIIVSGIKRNRRDIRNMIIGGIYLGAKPTKERYIKTIADFQNSSIIPLFITVDMEGFRNPFANFQEFPTFAEIETKEEAYEVGYNHGKVLKELGFSINFAPVVDLRDDIWKCRSFPGTPEEIAEKSNYYINGLQENQIIATSKHYPGKTLVVDDPHKVVVSAEIDKNDLLPFKGNIKNNVHAIMVSHIIVKGDVDSESKPSVVSERIIKGLKEDFTGLVITDEIKMLGLKNYYLDINEMFIDVFKANNDVILNFDISTRNIYDMINAVAEAVERGEISEERIDKSVTKILNAKGIRVI